MLDNLVPAIATPIGGTFFASLNASAALSRLFSSSLSLLLKPSLQSWHIITDNFLCLILCHIPLCRCYTCTLLNHLLQGQIRFSKLAILITESAIIKVLGAGSGCPEVFWILDWHAAALA